MRQRQGEPSSRAATPSFELDVFLQGAPVHRSATVELRDDVLAFADERLPLGAVFWVSRRAGLVLLFARGFTCALKGAGHRLDELGRGVERRLDRATQRRILHPLNREVVVCTAGTAVTGRVADDRLRGLALAVFTQRGLHLICERRRYSLSWPVESAERRTSANGRQALRLVGGGVELELLYLFPEEIQAALRVATSTPPRGAGADTDALEMFARGEVAPPLPARLPEFQVSVETMREAPSRGAARVPVGSNRLSALGEMFFHDHFQELGEIALGPLMLRASAASGAGSLSRAVAAMDAEQLRQDTEAAAASATDRLVMVYTGELDRRLAAGRPEGTDGGRLQVTDAERNELDGRIHAALEPLNPLFSRLSESQSQLLQKLQTLEDGPPEGEEDEVEAAADEWRGELRRLDRAYGTAWRDLLDEVAEVWDERLIPRLRLAEDLPRRALPGWAGPALMTAAALAVALVIYVLLT